MNVDTGSPEAMFSKATSIPAIRKIYQLQRESERLDSSPRDLYSKFIYLLGRIQQRWKPIKRYLMDNLWVITALNLIVDILFCFFYLTEIEYNTRNPCKLDNCGNTGLPYFLLTNRLPTSFQWLVGISIFKLALIILTVMFFVDNIYQFLTSPSTLLDILIIVPFIGLSRVKDSKFIFVPYFLRCFLLIPSLKAYLRLRARKGICKMNEYTEKLIILASYIWTLLYFGVCAFNYFETRIPSNFPSDLSLIDSFYFIVITMSTVGYGEITPKTVPGKLVIVVLIFVGIAALPGLISDLQDTLKMQSNGAGSYSPGRNPFVVVCGTFTETNRMVDLLDSILRRDPYGKTRIVLLSRDKISVEIKYLIKQYHLRQRVFFLQGGGLDTEDLERVSLDKAAAAIILANSQSENPRLEDEHNTLRAWAFDQYAPSVPIFLETLLPQTAIVQEDLITGGVCINEFKQIFLGYNTLYMGSGTLMINLLRGARSFTHYDKPWHEVYGDGAHNEIFKMPLNPVFVGHCFSELSLYLFRQFQVILFALHMHLPDQQTNHVVLNPGKSYVLKPKDAMFLIAPSRDVLSDIGQLNYAEFERTKNPVSRVKKAFHLVVPSPGMIDSGSHDTLGDLDEDIYVGRPQTHNYKVSHCVLLKTPMKLDQITLSRTDLKGHVLIISKDFNFFRYVCTLRLASLMPQEIRPIVVLCPRLPNHQEFTHLQSFPKIFFMVGDAHNPVHLKRANIFDTYKVLLINMSNSRTESSKMNPNVYRNAELRTGSHFSEMTDDALADSSTIMISNMIDKMFAEQNRKKPVIVDLIRRNNVKFLSPGLDAFVPKVRRGSVAETAMKRLRKSGGTGSDIHYHPMFASGSVITPIMLEAILSSAYQMPSLINIFNAFVGIRYPIDIELDNELEFEKSRLCYVNVPQELVGRTFGHVYTVFSEVLGVVPLGILRNNTTNGNILPFVITNPLWSWIVHHDDCIYVLAPPSVLK